MKETDKDWMIRMVGGWLFLLVPAHQGSPGQRAGCCCCSILLKTCFRPKKRSSKSATSLQTFL